jgi:hypothetical protein
MYFLSAVQARRAEAEREAIDAKLAKLGQGGLKQRRKRGTKTEMLAARKWN